MVNMLIIVNQDLKGSVWLRRPINMDPIFEHDLTSLKEWRGLVQCLRFSCFAQSNNNQSNRHQIRSEKGMKKAWFTYGILWRSKVLVIPRTIRWSRCDYVTCSQVTQIIPRRFQLRGRLTGTSRWNQLARDDQNRAVTLWPSGLLQESIQ